jgi:hypothetical protein
VVALVELQFYFWVSLYGIGPVRVRSKKERWGKEAFLDAGEATFGE